MVCLKFDELKSYIFDLLRKLGMSAENSGVMADIYIDTTKRGVGHHDIYNFPQRADLLLEKKMKANPAYERISAFGAMERWDGDNGPGELINYFSMQRAISLAREHGIGMCTMRNSNHYLCSAPFVEQAARQGYIGFIIAKGVPSMGVPGIAEKIIGQSPIGFAFPVGEREPVMLDICLAYASGEQLEHCARKNIPVPGWWGIDKEGNPTTSAEELLAGTKFPIGGHKGFGLAILCELLTGVLSGGRILDGEEERASACTITSHTAFAIKADALMPMEEYSYRSNKLVERIRARGDSVHIPGDSSWEKRRVFEEKKELELTEELVAKLNEYGCKLGLDKLGEAG